MTLDAFLTARLDEDEAAAKAVRPDQDYADSQHQERWSPARVLREVAAKRAILALHQPDQWNDCQTCLSDRDDWQENWVADYWPCMTLRHMAAIYSDHPDYKPEWHPGYQPPEPEPELEVEVDPAVRDAAIANAQRRKEQHDGETSTR